MWFETLSSPVEALSAVVRIGGAGIAISSAEMLVAPSFIGPSGLLVAGPPLTRRPWMLDRRAQSMLQAGLAYRGLLAVLAIRLAAGLLLAVQPGGLEACRWVVFVVTAASLLLRLRAPHATHAAGAMSVIILVSASAGLALNTRVAVEIVLWFIAAQAWLAYFTAGVSKLLTSSWREGRAVTSILSTQVWGNRRTAQLLLDRSFLGVVLCWATMAGESVMPLTLIAPFPVMIALLCLAIGFHLGTAVDMGLNMFVWMFAATYPAIIFCWCAVHPL